MPVLSLISALALLTPQQVHGQTVVDTVKSFMSNVGVPGPARLQGLSPLRRDGTQTGWSLTLEDAKDRSYEAHLTPSGRILNLSLPGVHPGTGMTEPLVDPKSRKLVQMWLKTVKGNETTGEATMVLDKKGMAAAYFPILRNGYQFVASWQTYGYRFGFSKQTGRFLGYSALENPPPVSSAKPVLDEQAALKAVKKIWDTEIIPQAKKDRGWRVWYDLTGKRELGYYLPEGETQAKLVWKVPYNSMRDVGHAIQGGSSGMLVDAVTGKQVKTPYSI